jgi:hypothetical protein
MMQAAIGKAMLLKAVVLAGMINNRRAASNHKAIIKTNNA